MVLVWNDHYCEVIEEDIGEKYDSRYETIVRKLFLRWMVDDPSQFSVSPIQKAFQKLGRIESVEMIKLPNATDYKNVAEAYVTFKNSLEAHNTVQVNKIRPITKEVLKLVHADTWHQASHTTEHSKVCETYDTSDSEECFILKLNDHCLLKIFEFFDLDTLIELSEVCQRFRFVLESFVFPKFKSFKFRIKTSSSNTGTTLGAVRKKLRCVGLHLNELDYEQNSLDCQRVIEKLVQYTGINLQALKLRIGTLDENYLLELAPILKILHALIIRVNLINCKPLNLLRKLCPGLVRLNICIKRGHVYDIEMASPWISIEHLTLKIFDWHHVVELPPLPAQMVRSLFENIPLLKTFRCDFISNGIIEAITENLVNIQEIHVSMSNMRIGLQITRFESLHNLTHLILNLGSTSTLDPALSYIEDLTKLRQLKLIAVITMYDFDYRHWIDHPIDDLMRPLPMWLSFVSVSLTRDVSTLTGTSEQKNVIEAKPLSFCVDIKDVPSDGALFINMVTVSNPDNQGIYVNDRTKQQIHRNISTFFHRSKTFYRNLNKSLTIEDRKIRQYIEVGTFY